MSDSVVQVSTSKPPDSQDELIDELVKTIRHFREPRPGKTSWERFLSSPGSAALLTVIGTGLFGAWLTSEFQKRSKALEIGLQAEKEQLTRKLETLATAYRLAGSYLAASEDLLVVTKPEFNPKGITETEREKIEEQKRVIRIRYNTADTQWRTENESLRFLISYYYRDNPDVKKAWVMLKDSLESYSQCAADWQSKYPFGTTERSGGACSDKKQTALSSFGHFNTQVINK